MKRIENMFLPSNVKEIIRACKFCLNFQEHTDTLRQIYYSNSSKKYIVEMSHPQEGQWGSMIDLDQHFVKSAINFLRNNRPVWANS